MECLFFYSAVLTKSVTFAPVSASMQRAMFNHWTVFALLLLPALFFYPCHSQCGGEYWGMYLKVLVCQVVVQLLTKISN